MPTNAEIVEYLASKGLVDIRPWHDARAISAMDPLTRSQFCAGFDESLNAIASNLHWRRARFGIPTEDTEPAIHRRPVP